MQDGTINSASAYNSDFWLINAWYIRLKTVDLGYQLPKTALPKFLDNVRFYVNAYNLLTFTGYDKYQQDPEIKTNTAVSYTHLLGGARVKVFVSGQNLFTKAANELVDPEVSFGNYPLQRCISTGINVKF